MQGRKNLAYEKRELLDSRNNDLSHFVDWAFRFKKKHSNSHDLLFEISISKGNQSFSAL